MSEAIKEKLMNFITRSFMVEKDEIDFDLSMIDQGIIDSFGLVEIAGFIEKEFDISVTEAKMIRPNFGSANKIIEFVKRELDQ